MKAQSAIKSPAAITRQLHGQSAMEYVTSYGLMILAIGILLGIFYFLVVPLLKPPSVCRISAEIACYSAKLHRETATIDLDVAQFTRNRVRVDQVSCTMESAPAYTALASPVEIEPQQHMQVSGGATGNIVSCRNAEGVTFAPKPEEEYFTGKLCILYTERETAISKSVCGQLLAYYE